MATQNFVEKFQFDASGFQLLNGQIPLVVRNVILISNFIFLFFSISWKRERYMDFNVKKKSLLTLISTTK